MFRKLLALGLSPVAALFPPARRWVRMLGSPTTPLPRSRAFFRGEPPCPVGVLDQAVLDFLEGWRSTFGEDEYRVLTEALREGYREGEPRLIIQWKAGDTFPSAVRTDGKHVRGELVSRVRLSVASRAGWLGDTAFFHELVHWALVVLAGPGASLLAADPDHEGPRWSGWTGRHTALITMLKRRYRAGGTFAPESMDASWLACGSCELSEED